MDVYAYERISFASLSNNNTSTTAISKENYVCQCDHHTIAQHEAKLEQPNRSTKRPQRWTLFPEDAHYVPAVNYVSWFTSLDIGFDHKGIC